MSVHFLERNSRNYFNGFIEKDRLLPDEFEALLQGNKTESNFIEVGIKLLHHGPTNNCIIRPAQIMQIQNEFIDNPVMRLIYCYMKCLKHILEVDIKSYFLKKVLLRNEFKSNIELHLQSANAQAKPVFLNGTLFDVMSFPDIRVKFESKIDFKKWNQSLDEIPIFAENLPEPFRNKSSLSLKTDNINNHQQKIIIALEKYL